MKVVKSMNPWVDVFGGVFHDKFFNELAPKFEKEFFGENVGFRPKADIIKKETGYEITLALAGLKKEDVKIDLHNNVLTISGERKTETNSGDKEHLRREIRYGKFSRSFTLHTDVNQEKIEASFTDGLLKIELPFSEKKSANTIEIK